MSSPRPPEPFSRHTCAEGPAWTQCDVTDKAAPSPPSWSACTWGQSSLAPPSLWVARLSGTWAQEGRPAWGEEVAHPGLEALAPGSP